MSQPHPKRGYGAQSVTLTTPFHATGMEEQRECEGEGEEGVEEKGGDIGGEGKEGVEGKGRREWREGEEGVEGRGMRE